MRSLGVFPIIGVEVVAFRVVDEVFVLIAFVVVGFTVVVSVLGMHCEL